MQSVRGVVCLPEIISHRLSEDVPLDIQVSSNKFKVPSKVLETVSGITSEEISSLSALYLFDSKD